MKSTVSVQIVTYNSESDIEACLSAVLKQTYPIFKTIVIDNNSQDETALKVRAFPNVQLVLNQQNTGFAPAHNQAIHMTNTDYVLVLNPDVQLHDTYIENIIEILESNSCMGMATGKLYRDINNKLLDSTGIRMKKNRRAIDRGANEIDTGQYDQLTNVFGVSGAAVIYKRKMINDISYESEFFDESFFAYKEDVDVSWRAQVLGWQAVFVPNAIATHGRGWKEEKKRSEVPVYIRQKSYINRYFYILKNDTIFNFIMHLPYILFFEIASFIYTLSKERELLKAWEFFKQQFVKMKLKRDFIKQKQKVSNKFIRSFFKGIW
ncbi:glycosyltransferase family 2 protein [Lysinibacillus sp. KU-BSD001]|uniref:glycosyltransferase family 2 protein n=1 Tax=Lysinibacillus sp. KU-BSD001 TaxID=3141328 RepID=UPI0036EB3FE5